MFRGHDKEQTKHVAVLCVAIYNHIRSKGDKLERFEDLYPYSEKNEARNRVTPQQREEIDRCNRQLLWEKYARRQRKGGC